MKCFLAILIFFGNVTKVAGDEPIPFFGCLTQTQTWIIGHAWVTDGFDTGISVFNEYAHTEVSPGKTACFLITDETFTDSQLGQRFTVKNQNGKDFAVMILDNTLPNGDKLYVIAIE